MSAYDPTRTFAVSFQTSLLELAGAVAGHLLQRYYDAGRDKAATWSWKTK
jgi:hypothetical protein